MNLTKCFFGVGIGLVGSILITPKVLAAEYYVSTTGNDASTGSQVTPWRTIQKAANMVVAGDTVYVNAGSYAERVRINKSGASAQPIVFKAIGQVIVKGFGVGEITPANYITIDGFEVANAMGYGILVTGSYCVIQNNYVHYASEGGIILRIAGNPTNTTNCIVRNNRLRRNAQFGIDIRGRNHLIENNEVWDTIQHHPNRVPSPAWADADGMHFHGSGHIFRNNYIHDIVYDGVFVIDSHSDCFQTFQVSQEQEAATNILFEKNRCDNPETGPNPEAVAKGWMIQWGSNIKIRNNLVRTYCGIQANTNSRDIVVENNTFSSIATLTTANHPTGITFNDVPSAVVKNNIFYDLPGHIIYQTNSTFAADKNLTYRSDGVAIRTSNTYNHSNDLWGVNPLIVGNGDWHLQANSPAIDKGVNLPEITDDFDGNSRPQGAGIDIGAFEYAAATVVSPTPTPTPKPGDADNDLVVGTTDLQIWLRNYLQSLSGSAVGDFDQNGKVDGVDYVIWLINYGK